MIVLFEVQLWNLAFDIKTEREWIFFSKFKNNQIRRRRRRARITIIWNPLVELAWLMANVTYLLTKFSFLNERKTKHHTKSDRTKIMLNTSKWVLWSAQSLAKIFIFVQQKSKTTNSVKFNEFIRVFFCLEPVNKRFDCVGVMNSI